MTLADELRKIADRLEIKDKGELFCKLINNGNDVIFSNDRKRRPHGTDWLPSDINLGEIKLSEDTWTKVKLVEA